MLPGTVARSRSESGGGRRTLRVCSARAQHLKRRARAPALNMPTHVRLLGVGGTFILAQRRGGVGKKAA